MTSKDYTVTELSNLELCENQHKLRDILISETSAMKAGTFAHEKFLEGKHIEKKSHDPDALFAFLSSLRRLTAHILAAFFRLPLLAQILLVIIFIMLPSDAPGAMSIILGISLVVWVWIDQNEIRKDIRDRKWEKHPLRKFAEEQLNAELVYIEGRFRGPFRSFNKFSNGRGSVILFGWFPNRSRLKGKPDLILKDSDGLLFPVDCKTRKTPNISDRDITQLSGYRYILGNNRTIFGDNKIADFGYILFLNENGFPLSFKKTALHSHDHLLRLADRALAIDKGTDPSRFSQSITLCQNCLFTQHCAEKTVS